MSENELKLLAAELAPLLLPALRAGLVPPTVPFPPQSAAPLPHKLTVAQFAWCIERSAYFVNEQSRINPKFRAHVQGKCPKLIHPAALALFGVDSAHAAARLALWQQPSAA